jgi:uncharacterized protein (DUF1778 family)
MPKISMLIPDDALALIDRHASGNRTAFMMEAAVARARGLERERTDRDIIAALTDDPAADAAVRAAWHPTLADGISR